MNLAPSRCLSKCSLVGPRWGDSMVSWISPLEVFEDTCLEILTSVCILFRRMPAMKRMNKTLKKTGLSRKSFCFLLTESWLQQSFILASFGRFLIPKGATNSISFSVSQLIMYRLRVYSRKNPSKLVEISWFCTDFHNTRTRRNNYLLPLCPLAWRAEEETIDQI